MGGNGELGESEWLDTAPGNNSNNDNKDAFQFYFGTNSKFFGLRGVSGFRSHTEQCFIVQL